MPESPFNTLDLFQELQKDNPWWRTNKIPEDWDKKFCRSDFYRYLEVLDSSDVQVIIGPRRVGKTILLYQLVKHLIEKRGVESRRIIYLDLAKPYVVFNIGGILPCLKLFQESILKKDFMDLSKGERVYVFIDEVQKEKNWALNIEGLRSRKLPISFLVTGSSGTEIDKTASESLVGRANYRYVLPLKFRDVVRKELGYDQNKLGEVKELSEIFKSSVADRDPRKLHNYILSELFTTSLTPGFKIKVRDVLESFLLKGGYPEFYEEYKEIHWALISKRMRDDYFERIISRDIVEAFNVNRPDLLRMLYILIGYDTSNLSNFGNYAVTMQTRTNTLINYFDYLYRSFLVSSSEKYYPKRRPRGEQKKVYVHDIGMRNAVLGLTKEDIPKQKGLIVETVVHSHCMRLKYKLHPTNEFKLNYWRNKNKKEIDIILDLGNLLLPIEVKYSNNIGQSDKETILQFINENKKKCSFGIIVTDDLLFLDEQIIGIPLWLFLLIC